MDKLEEQCNEKVSLKWMLFCISVFLAGVLTVPVSLVVHAKMEQQTFYKKMFAENAVKEFPVFNQLCNTYIGLSVREGWTTSAREWGDMCHQHNKEFFEKYAP